MTTYTDAKDALLFGLAKSLRDSGRPDPQHIQRLIIAAQSTAEPDQPKPSEQKERDAKTAYIRSVQRSAIFVCPAKDRALSHNEEACENCDCIGLSSEPKPSARANRDARKAFCDALQGYNIGTLNEALAALDVAAPYICAGKDRDTATVIADNDAKMAKIERWKQAFNDANRQIFEVCEDRDAKMATNERLKHSLELYRADIHTMQEREATMTAERKAMRTEIERLKKIIEGANDIDAATKRLRTRYPYLAIEECLGMARAVYGMESCNK